MSEVAVHGAGKRAGSGDPMSRSVGSASKEGGMSVPPQPTQTWSPSAKTPLRALVSLFDGRKQ